MRRALAAPPEAATPKEFASARVKLLHEAGASVSAVEVSEVRGAAAKLPFVMLDSLSRPVPDGST